MTASRDAVLTALKTVTDPATGTDIVASGVMRALNVDDAGAVRFVMEIPPAQAKAYEEAKALAEAALVLRCRAVPSPASRLPRACPCCAATKLAAGSPAASTAAGTAS